MVAAGLVAPIALTADLHQPARAWHFYAQTRFGSVMWYGAYLLPLFSLLSMLLGWLLLRPALARRGAEGDKIARLAKLLCLGSWSGHVWLRPLSLLAALSGLSIALYTGLETMAVAARPLWHTPWLPWLLTLSAVLGAQSALLLLNRLLTGWGAETESTLLRQSGWTLGLLALSLLGWALFGGASAAEAAALYRLDPSWRLAAHWLLLTLGLASLLMLLRRRISARLSLWGLALLGLHLVWGLRWLVLIQGQLAPKYGAGVYLYEIAWGRPVCSAFSAPSVCCWPCWRPSRSWCAPLLPPPSRHPLLLYARHSDGSQQTQVSQGRRHCRRHRVVRRRLQRHPQAGGDWPRHRQLGPADPGSHPWQLAGRGVPG
ncbi:NrfD/PsrC family molybdoenzyme membrane anchor subunit [Aeromonas hydrophila]